MSATQREIILPLGYSSEERAQIAEEILAYIVERTKAGRGADGKKFPKYSKGYTESLAFKQAGKSKAKIDLTLSGEMLDELEVVKNVSGKIVIGYGKNSTQAGKAEGNILGTYGTDTPDESKARDFLEVSQNEVSKILKHYPMERTNEGRKTRKENVQRNSDLNNFSSDIIDRLEFEE